NRPLKRSAGSPAPSLRVHALAQVRQTLVALAHEPGQLILKGLGSPAPSPGRLAGSTGRIVHLADGKTNLAVAHVDDLDLDDIVLLEVVLDIVDVRVSDLRNVHQTRLSLTQFDERAEIGDAGDPPLQNAANFDGHAETNSSSIKLPRGTNPRAPLLYVLRIFVSINGCDHLQETGTKPLRPAAYGSSTTMTRVSPGLTSPNSSRATRSMYASLL